MELPFILMFVMVVVTTLSLRRQHVPRQLTAAQLRRHRALHVGIYAMMALGGTLAALMAFARPKDLPIAGILLLDCVMMMYGLRSYLGRLDAALERSAGDPLPSSDRPTSRQS